MRLTIENLEDNPKEWEDRVVWEELYYKSNIFIKQRNLQTVGLNVGYGNRVPEFNFMCFQINSKENGNIELISEDLTESTIVYAISFIFSG